MATIYRIKYKIVEPSVVRNDVRMSEMSVEEFIEYIGKNYRDATYVYVELLETLERPDVVSSSATDGLIILP